MHAHTLVHFFFPPFNPCLFCLGFFFFLWSLRFCNSFISFLNMLWLQLLKIDLLNSSSDVFPVVFVRFRIVGCYLNWRLFALQSEHLLKRGTSVCQDWKVTSLICPTKSRKVFKQLKQWGFLNFSVTPSRNNIFLILQAKAIPPSCLKNKKAEMWSRSCSNTSSSELPFCSAVFLRLLTPHHGSSWTKRPAARFEQSVWFTSAQYCLCAMSSLLR